jgi:hypothetical protein
MTLTNIQRGYLTLPRYATIKRFVQSCGENFEWVLVLLLLLWLMLSSIHDKQISKMIVDSPQRNDFFFVDYFTLNDESDAKYRYIPMRVLEVKDKSLVFKVGNVGFARKISPTKHVIGDRAMHKNFYRKDTIELSLVQLAEMFESDIIYAAVRPHNIFIDGWVVMNKSEL